MGNCGKCLWGSGGTIFRDVLPFTDIESAGETFFPDEGKLPVVDPKKAPAPTKVGSGYSQMDETPELQ